MIQSIQKVIKVGSSGAVTIPAKEMKRLGITYGDDLKVSFEVADIPDENKLELVALTQKLIKRHKTALSHLSNR